MSTEPSTSSGLTATTSTSINREYPEPSIETLSSDDETTTKKSTMGNIADPKLDKESNSKDSNDDKKDDSAFECNICLDTAKDAVVSLCGHLFCWPCLHQWLETGPTRQLCPVCKAAISKDKVIPLYGRGSAREDPRSKVPPRPAGQRAEPEPANGFQGFGFGDGGFHISFGIGAFPFGIFTSTFNMRGQNPTTGMNFEDDTFLSKAFLWVAVIFLAWLEICI